jgi:hypothetical protein
MTCQKLLLPLLLLASLAGSPLAMAQSAENGNFSMSDEPFPKLSEMNWLDERFLDNQRQLVSDLAYEHYRRKLEDVRDVQALLQKILDDKLVKQDDIKSLQALGVVLGDQFILANHKLKWTMYEDELGDSHAICVGSTKHCIFPLSTLARRANIGISPDVAKVYNKVMNEMAPYLGK